MKKFRVADLVDLTYDGGTNPMQKFLRGECLGEQLSPSVRANFGLDGVVIGYEVSGPEIHSAEDAIAAVSHAVKSSLITCPVCEGCMVWEACDSCGDVGYVLGRNEASK